MHPHRLDKIRLAYLGIVGASNLFDWPPGAIPKLLFRWLFLIADREVVYFCNGDREKIYSELLVRVARSQGTRYLRSSGWRQPCKKTNLHRRHPKIGAAQLLCCSCAGWRAERFSSLWTPRGELDAPGLPAQHRCVVRTVGSFCVVAKRAALRQSVRGHAVARADIDRSSALCLVFLLRPGFRRGSEIATSRCVPSHCVAHFE